MMIFRIFALALVTSSLISCNDDVNNFNPDKDPLTGQLGGKEWTYGSGNASYDFLDATYSGVILEADLQDPCTRVPGAISEAHVVVKFPGRKDNFNLPYINNSSNTAEVIFDLPDGKQYTATSGFLEIVEINSTEVIGFISADYDDNNQLEGAFLLRVCN